MEAIRHKFYDEKHQNVLNKYISSGIYMFNVNNKNTRTKCEIYSKLTIKTPVWCLYY